MDAYIVGNLVGRLVLSYLVVWMLMLVFSRIKARSALQKTGRWYGVTMVLVLFTAGLAVSI